MLGNKRGLAVLAAVAVVAGLAMSAVVSADEYDEIARVAEGVYLVQGEEGRFRVDAADDVSVLVYDSSGRLVVARELDAGDARDFIVSDGLAVVAIFNGAASLEAKGEGIVEKLDVTSRTFTVTEGSGEAIDESLTAQIPPFLVGIDGNLDGTAENLQILVESEKGIILQVTQNEALGLDEALAVEALQVGVVDVTVTADALDGAIEVLLLMPDLRGMFEMREEHIEKHEMRHEHKDVEAEVPEEIAIAELEMVPIAFSLDSPGMLTLGIDEGYLVDLSVYDANGFQAAYIHRGPDLLEARSFCHDFTECMFGYGGYDELTPETIDAELAPGEYVLFVRAGAADANLTLVDASGESLLATFEELELVETTVEGSQEIQLAGPLLDLWPSDWGFDALESVRVTVEGNEVYSYSSTVKLGGPGFGGSGSYDPSMLSAGLVVVEASSATSGLFGGGPMGGAQIHLFSIAEA